MKYFKRLGEFIIKALILAGGYGTRLRPLSYTRPKLLFPVAGKTMLEWILNNICTDDFDEVILAVNYLADILKKRIGSKIDNLDINYSVETEPLGTGGPIKKAEAKLKDMDNFLIINGDILADFNLKRMLEFHNKKEAVATIALFEVEEPSRFGVVEFNQEMRVLKFVEKPKETNNKWINAGIYLMNREILKFIPSKRKVSLEKEIFPLLSKKRKLYGFKLTGMWHDVGDINAFQKANYDMIEKESDKKPLLYKNTDIDKSARIKPPIIIRENVKIDSFSEIGPSSVISQNSQIEKRVVIKNSIIFENVKIGESTLIERAIIGGNVEIGSNVKIGQNCIISDHVIIRDNITISEGAIIHPHKEVENDVESSGHIL